MKITSGLPVRVYPTETNFVLIKAEGKSREIYGLLLERSIKIRLLGDYLRITALEKKEDDIILDALKEIIGSVYK